VKQILLQPIFLGLHFRFEIDADTESSTFLLTDPGYDLCLYT